VRQIEVRAFDKLQAAIRAAARSKGIGGARFAPALPPS
jgi:hypothetical protein